MMKYLIIFCVTLLFANPINLLNEYRNSVRLNSLKENKYLDIAAKKHAYFLYKNHILSHYESRKYPYFIGATPELRAVNVGYSSRFIVENISSGEKTYKQSIKDLFSAIYHRIGFLDFNINEIGYAKIAKLYVYDMGNGVISKACKTTHKIKSGYIKICKNKSKIISKSSFNLIRKSNPKVIMWPYPNMKNTPTVFYSEIPDPLPNYDVCGYPISIFFNPYYYKKIKLIDFKISGVPFKVITKSNDINHKLKYNQFALFPLKRLEYGKIYSIHARFILNGNIKVFNWKFSTKKINNLLNVARNNQIFYIKSNKLYTIYFKPVNKQDVITNFRYQYTSTLNIKQISFKDANTIYLKVNGYGKIILFTPYRKVTLIIKDK